MLEKLLKAFLPMVQRMPKSVQETKRTILYQNKDVAVVSFQWKKGMGLPEHDHYGKCLFQVVDGKLLETRGKKETLMKIADVGRINKGQKHAITPLANAKSLHIYSPPPPCLKK
jgi:quercetin dioxygenase-like cupin family protein